MVTNVKGKSYKEKLAAMGMSTLEESRKRGDLIRMYGIKTGKDSVEISTWFTPGQKGALSTRLVTGCLNVEKRRGKNEVRNNIWSISVIDTWNSLPDYVKASPDVNTFKNSIDNLLS